MESISYHITPIVINSLGADTYECAHAHTRMYIHTDTYTKILTSQTKNFKKLGAHWPLAGAHLV